ERSLLLLDHTVEPAPHLLEYPGTFPLEARRSPRPRRRFTRGANLFEEAFVPFNERVHVAREDSPHPRVPARIEPCFLPLLHRRFEIFNISKEPGRSLDRPLHGQTRTVAIRDGNGQVERFTGGKRLKSACQSRDVLAVVGKRV